MSTRERLYLDALARVEHERAMMLAIAPPAWTPEGGEEERREVLALWTARARWWQGNGGA